ncbi:MAG: cupin domain-containing protein [Acetobacter sp.]|nr:cupin domain-containing protein [Acetobacter sp.]
MKKNFMLVVICMLSACGNITDNHKSMFAKGEPNPYGQYFTGNSYLANVNNYDKTLKMPVANVTFEPCTRTNWHYHTGGQVLLITNGEGRHQIRGQEIEILRPGDVVKVAPYVEHWHGAAPNSWFSHIALTPNPDDNQPVWLKPVTDEEYKK